MNLPTQIVAPLHSTICADVLDRASANHSRVTTSYFPERSQFQITFLINPKQTFMSLVAVIPVCYRYYTLKKARRSTKVLKWVLNTSLAGERQITENDNSLTGTFHHNNIYCYRFASPSLSNNRIPSRLTLIIVHLICKYKKSSYATHIVVTFKLRLYA